MRENDRTGMLTPASHESACEIASKKNLLGQIVLLTGGASGIGKETVLALSSAGAKVYMAVRDLNKGREAIDDIVRRCGGKCAPLELLEMDLASSTSIRGCAQEFTAKEKKLDILINNAAIMALPELILGEKGFELQFETNHLGHFLLTTLLFPQLKSAKSARVVCVSSTEHRQYHGDFTDINYSQRPYSKWDAYGQSKLANILFAREMNNRLSLFGGSAYSLHPGAIMTNLQKNLSQEEMTAMGWMSAEGILHQVFKSPAYGAATTVYAAIDDDALKFSGEYLEDCSLSTNISILAKDEKLAEKLWKISSEAIAI